MTINSSKGEYRLTAVDGWRIIVILILYGILSFFHLGSMEGPQTFWYPEEGINSVVFDLEEIQEISYLRQITGARFGTFYITASDDNINYSEIGILEQDKVFAWQDMELNAVGRYIKLTSGEKIGSIGEIAFFNSNGQKIKAKGMDAISELLVDEQNVVPDEISYMNTTYFDEIYHARTAYEYAHGMKIYEWTHPPLGKLIMSIPIRLFGMTPFNYRVMGNLAGLLMLVVIYIFAKRMFKSTRHATLAMVLFAVDGMHFVQTRIGTVDSY
ncbi:MAG: phospholipid carrier-dependent glycosyltransferase, partial [Cellulosilyticum sp.]|nr:phospholipid carrier-dependent glycosyltransferase [Cellulosilyticum sp.]